MGTWGGSRGNRHAGRRARDRPADALHEHLGRGHPTPREIDFDAFLPHNVEETEEQPLPAQDPRVRTDLDETFTRVVNEDYRLLRENKFLHLEPDLIPYLFMQSIAGRANQGHGAFRFAENRRSIRYPNATVEDIYTALGVSWKQAWEHRQSWIDDLKVWLERAARDPQDPRVLRLCSTDGRPLGGSDFIGERVLPDARAVLDVLAGFSFGSVMDSYEWRRQVMTRHDLEMGGGECWAGDLRHIKEAGETLEKLASEEHDEARLAELVRAGALIDRPMFTLNDVRNIYVRRKRGKGVSDDAAIIIPAILYSPWCLYGVLLADFVDTIDKSAARIERGGQDEMLGEMVRYARGSDLTIPTDRLVDLIYLSAIDPVRPVQWMHCSQRYFYEDNNGHYAARLHRMFVQGARGALEKGDRDGRFERMREAAIGLPVRDLSFAQVNSREFYLAIVNRLEAAQKKGIITL